MHYVGVLSGLPIFIACRVNSNTFFDTFKKKENIYEKKS